jgi:hypothetical protein
MKRADSGFHESFHPKTSHDSVAPLQRCSTAPTARRKINKNPSIFTAPGQPSETKMQRPASENRLRPTHQRSTTAPSEDSITRSRGHGHGSKPSSHRTSCTVIDPSRPARHYRMKSSQTVPTATSRDIDDVLALHFRSCSLFQNPSIHTHSSLPSPSVSHAGRFDFSNAVSRLSTDEAEVPEEHVMPKHDEDMIGTAENLNTTIHWTSPTTRMRDYKRIDKANSGFRGLLNKVVPRCVSGPQEKFYEKDQSDTGSVRRYRLDDVHDALNEKDDLQSRSCAVESSQPTKKKWICF